MGSIKSILRNKNVVTILGAIVLIVVLIVGYNYEVNKALEKVDVVVATRKINPRTEITAEDVKVISVSSSAVPDGVIRNKDAVVGKYSNFNVVIPEGGMVHKDFVVEKKELPDSALEELKIGERLYMFPVNFESTYYNMMMPGNYVNIMMQGVDENGNIFVGELFHHIKILDVRDSSGAHVFDSSDYDRTPASLFFGLTYENWYLLKKAESLNTYSVDVYPIPYTQANEQTLPENYIYLPSEKLKDMVEANSEVQDERFNFEFENAPSAEDNTKENE